jgi:hypothetical protein
VLIDNSGMTGAPIVVERNPTYYNLIGRLDYRAVLGTMVTDFRQIKPGALHRANGGFLVLHALDVMPSPFAWEELKRALLSGEVRIENPGEQLSALSGLPLNQGIAATGAVNQHGEVQAVGGVTRKIEGFYDVCRERVLTRARGDRADGERQEPDAEGGDRRGGAGGTFPRLGGQPHRPGDRVADGAGGRRTGSGRDVPRGDGAPAGPGPVAGVCGAATRVRQRLARRGSRCPRTAQWE